MVEHMPIKILPLNLHHPDKSGNIRDYANVSQLVCLSNLESLNAVLINDGDEYLAIGLTEEKQ